MTGSKSNFQFPNEGVGSAAASCTAVDAGLSTDSGDTRKAFPRMSKGNASDARGALSSVKLECKDSSGAISRDEKLLKLPFVAKK